MSDADKYTLTEKHRIKIIKEIESYQVELELASFPSGPSWITGNDTISIKNKQKSIDILKTIMFFLRSDIFLKYFK